MSNFKYTGFDLSGKVAIVTGSASGIGQAMAIGLARAGADLALVDVNKEGLNVTAGEIRKTGRKAEAYVVDITNLKAVQTCVDEIEKEFGKINILMNNAGIVIKSDLKDVTEAEWDKLMNVNLKGAFFFAQTVGKVMMKQKNGKIINTLSNCAFVAEHLLGVYCATKGGLLMITKCLASEWAQYGINVNGVGPAFIKTPINDPLLKDQHFKDWSLNRIPFHRMGEPEELVGAAIYLASDSSSFVNGAVLMVDGGFTAV
jgi:NAD(P)-dependent dehydrogenase (short-subunit alcohol dehydrogenase family)